MRIIHLSIYDVSQLILNREVSPVDLVDSCIKQIEKVDNNLFSYIEVFADESLQMARDAEREILSGKRISPLHGIPITLKDNIGVKGKKTTAGSNILSNWISDEDANITVKLNEAGAIIIGKTNLHEFAWGATNENPFYGTVKNPWDSTRIAGGSSGGSAVAVAAHTCFGSIGTDTGGSIRLPAAICGLVGMRPTYGRVSNNGIIPLASSMDTAGPITRTVKDNALLLRTISEFESSNANLQSEGNLFLNNLNHIKIGIIPELYGYATRSVINSVNNALKVLETLGASTVELKIKNINYVKQNKDRIQFSEASTFHRKWMTNRINDYGPDVRQRLLNGWDISAVHYIEAKRRSKLLKQNILEEFKEVDVILCPTVPFTAPEIGKTDSRVRLDDGSNVKTSDYISYFTSLASIIGLPALNLPCGFDEDNLPIGLQLIGKPFDEATLYNIGTIYQNVTKFHLQNPIS